MKRWLRVWILAAVPAVAWGQASTGLPAPSTAGINGVPVPTLATGYLYYDNGTGSFVFQSPGLVNNCASAYALAYYAASGTAVSCPAAFAGLGYFSTSAAPTAATGAQIVSALGSTAVNNATSAASFTGSLSGDVTGTQSVTLVGKINGGSVPASANLLATNTSGQPVAATAHNQSVPRTCTATNSGNAYTCTTSPSFTAAAGDTIAIDFNAANTGSATLAVNGAAAATIRKWGNSSLLASNDVLAGHWISATFDGTYWQLEGQLGNANATQVNGASVPANAALLATNSSSQLASVSTLPTTAVPAFTGDITNSAGSLTTTVGKINGGSVPASANLLATNTSGQPVAATAHNQSVPRTCTATNSGNAYTCTTSPSFTPAAGDTISISFNAANTGSATLAVDGAAAATIKKWGNSSNLVANDVLAGHWISATFDGTYWQLEGQLGNANSTQVNGASVPAGAALLATNSSSQLASVSTLPTSAVPAFTGDMTNTAGSLATTVGKINGGSVPASANLLATNASGQPVAATAHNQSAPRTCATSNTGNAYACTTSPSFTPTAGDTISINFNAANTGSATLAVNGAAAGTIKKWGNSGNLIANDVLTGHWINATFDGTYWQLEGQLGNANSTQLNGASVPASASLLSSNASSQLTAATNITTTTSSTLGGSTNLFNNAAAATNVVEIQAGTTAVQGEELQWQNYSGTAEWQNTVDTSYTYHIKDAVNNLDRMTIYQGGGNTNINAGNGAYAVCLNCAANSGTSGMMVQNGASSPTTVLAVTGSGNTTASGFVSGKFFVGSGSMSPTPGAAAGTSPSIVCVTNHVCDGVSGTMTLTTGTSPTTGTLATLSFPNTHSNYANCMVITESASAVITTNTWTESTTAITITANAALAASTAYTVKYWCGGN
jgi:hypothetical protein